MMYAVPGGPVAALVGENATPEQIAAVTGQFGLDRLIFVQYRGWLLGALGGHLSLSLHSRDPVRKLIAERMPATLQLAVGATAIGPALGIPMALASALAQGSWLDRALSGWSAVALGVPTFRVGFMLILLFAIEFGLPPAALATCRSGRPHGGRRATSSRPRSRSLSESLASSRASCAAGRLPS